MIQDAFDQQCINHNNNDNYIDYLKLYEERRKREEQRRIIEERCKPLKDNWFVNNNNNIVNCNNLFSNSSSNNKRKSFDEDIMPQSIDSDSCDDNYYENDNLNKYSSDYSYNPYYSSDSF